MSVPRRVVVKVGSSVLSGGTDRLHRPRVVDLVRQLCALMASGTQAVLVSSGAVMAGWEALGFPARRRTLAEKQLLAAVGQGRLMGLYTTLAELYGVQVAQELLTASDFRDRTRYLNARETFLGCFAHGVLPIVNENDVVAVDEIKVGDNDTLGALVAGLLDADLLILLTDAPGLYTADPRRHPEARLIPVVERIDDAVWALAGEAGTHRGTGGMRTKIGAAAVATRAGTPVVIVSGETPDAVLRVVAGEALGTRFLPSAGHLEARKRWILSEVASNSRLTLDDGAVRALRERGGSVLPVGVRTVAGDFERGATVRLYTESGAEVARGLTRYRADDLRLIQGRHSSLIRELLGYEYGPEVVHRDDLVMM